MGGLPATAPTNLSWGPLGEWGAEDKMVGGMPATAPTNLSWGPVSGQGGEGTAGQIGGRLHGHDRHRLVLGAFVRAGWVWQDKLVGGCTAHGHQQCVSCDYLGSQHYKPYLLIHYIFD